MREQTPSLFATIERGASLSGDSCDESGVVEIDNPEGGEPTHVTIDTVPQDTMAKTPDDALKAAQAMQTASSHKDGKLGFKVEYLA